MLPPPLPPLLLILLLVCTTRVTKHNDTEFIQRILLCFLLAPLAFELDGGSLHTIITRKGETESETKEKESNLVKHTTKWIISKNRDFFCVVSYFQWTDKYKETERGDREHQNEEEHSSFSSSYWCSDSMSLSLYIARKVNMGSGKYLWWSKYNQACLLLVDTRELMAYKIYIRILFYFFLLCSPSLPSAPSVFGQNISTMWLTPKSQTK